MPVVEILQELNYLTVRAYNRTGHMPEQKKMMREWADYLDKLKAGAEVIPIKQSAQAYN